MDFEEQKRYFDETYWRGEKGVKSGYTASDYNLDDYIHLAIAEYLDKIFNLKCKNVLDTGCGLGYLVYRLRELGVDAYGQDISTYAIQNSPIPECVRECNGIEIRWCDKAPFDVIICIETLEHIPQSYVEKYLRNIVKILKPNGLFYASLPFGTDNKRSDDDPDETHQTLQPREWWESKLKRVGLLNRRDIEGLAYTITMQTKDMDEPQLLALHYRWNLMIWQKPKRFRIF